MNLLDTLRTLLRMGDRRVRTKLGLGDRRRSLDVCEQEAREELERLAWIKWTGERKPVDPV